jgi:RNA polymerase sigma-70 factor (ECF subfamily)
MRSERKMQIWTELRRSTVFWPDFWVRQALLIALMIRYPSVARGIQRTTVRSAPNSSSSDGQLLSSIADGDWSALGALFQLHGAAVRRFIRNCGVPACDADDLLQQTFLDVRRVSQRFDERSSCKRWLVGIAAIVVARHRRARWRQAARQAAYASDPALRPIERDAWRELEWRQSAHRALGALSQLAPKKRAVFEMLVLNELPGEEVARDLGVPIATVWTRMHYARGELKRKLTHPRHGVRQRKLPARALGAREVLG